MVIVTGNGPRPDCESGPKGMRVRFSSFTPHAGITPDYESGEV